jgi:hypothetical protein
MYAQRQKPVDFAAERLCIALSVSRNCGILVQWNFDSARRPVPRRRENLQGLTRFRRSSIRCAASSVSS